MKQADVKVDGEYMTRINGNLCRVRVTGKRVEQGTSWRKARTLFDWIRLNPPAGARVLRGSDGAASLRPVTADPMFPKAEPCKDPNCSIDSTHTAHPVGEKEDNE